MEYSSNAKAPPPLIPVNGINRYGSYPGADVMDLSATQQAQRQAQQQQNGRTVASSNKTNSVGGKGLVPIPDMVISGSHTPYQVKIFFLPPLLRTGKKSHNYFFSRFSGAKSVSGQQNGSLYQS